MSSPNLIVVPDLRITYQIGERSVSLDPVESLREIDRIAAVRDGCVGWEHLDDFAAWVKLKTGVELDRDAADFVIDSLRQVFLQRKRDRYGDSRKETGT